MSVSIDVVVLVLSHEDGMSDSYVIKFSDIPSYDALKAEVRLYAHQRTWMSEAGGLLEQLKQKAIFYQATQGSLELPTGYNLYSVLVACTWS